MKRQLIEISPCFSPKGKGVERVKREKREKKRVKREEREEKRVKREERAKEYRKACV